MQMRISITYHKSFFILCNMYRKHGIICIDSTRKSNARAYVIDICCYFPSAVPPLIVIYCNENTTVCYILYKYILHSTHTPIVLYMFIVCILYTDPMDQKPRVNYRIISGASNQLHFRGVIIIILINPSTH